MDGEARRARREARLPELRLIRAARAVCVAGLVACASVGDPPGGPPDQEPPVVVRVAPDSGTVTTTLPATAEIFLNEVVNERIAAQRPDIANAVLLSPVHGPVRVSWHRNRVSVRPREGFRPGRIYRLEVLPVFTDLRQNRMQQGRLVIFSTGPAFPSAALEGAVVDWPGGRPAVGALVEAVLLPDSLPYRAVADSTGSFALRQIPAGDYLVYGVVDQDNNRERGPREAFDTLRVRLADTASVEVFAFPHDTTGPRLRTVELADSLTLRLTFDRALDPAQALDTSAIFLAATADSTTRLPVAQVLTPQQLDSLRTARARAAADSARARPDSGRAAPDSAPAAARPDSAARAAPGDTARARRAGVDTALVRPRGPRVAAPAPAPLAVPAVRPGAPAQPGAARPGQTAAPRDSTRAQKMLARRPAPASIRLVRLTEPLIPGSRYLIAVTGVRSLAGVAGDARGQISVPLPPRRTPPPGGARGDTARAAPDTSRTGAAPTPPPQPRDTPRTPLPLPGRSPERR